MFLSEGNLAAIQGQAIQIATKSLAWWDLALMNKHPRFSHSMQRVTIIDRPYSG
jgi:hypothetical protein